MCKGIEESDVVVVCITKTYLEKVNGEDENDNCQMEFNYAMTQKTPMVAVVMEAEVREQNTWKTVGMRLGNVLYHDWSSEDSAKTENIFKEVLDRL